MVCVGRSNYVQLSSPVQMLLLTSPQSSDAQMKTITVQFQPTMQIYRQ